MSDYPRCPVQGKTAYPSRAAAERQRSRLHARLRFYYCPHGCRAWHLTHERRERMRRPA